MTRFIAFRTATGSILMVNPARLCRYYADGSHTVLVFGPDGDSSRIAESLDTVTDKLSNLSA